MAVRIASIAALCGLLAGCAAYERERNERAAADAAIMESNDQSVCMSYGAELGSNAYVQCRMNLSNQRAQVAANDRAIAMQYLLTRR